MISVYSVLSTLMLFSELSSHSVTMAMPTAEDGVSDQDGPFLGDEPLAEPDLAYRRNLVIDTNMRDEDGNPKIIIVSDMGLKGHSIRRLNPGFPQSFPLLTDRSLGHNAPEHSLKIDRRNTDIDILRCMIGRVYRPCWES